MESHSVSIVDELLSLSDQSDELIADPPVFFEKFEEWIGLTQKAAESILNDEPYDAMTFKTFLFPDEHATVQTTLSKLLIDNKSRIHTDTSTSKEVSSLETKKERRLLEDSSIKQSRCLGRQSRSQYSTKLSKKDQSVDHATVNTSDKIEPVIILSSATPIDDAQKKMPSDTAISHTPVMVILDQRITRSTSRSINRILTDAKAKMSNNGEPVSVVNSALAVDNVQKKTSSNTTSIAHSTVISASISKDKAMREKRKSSDETAPQVAKKLKIVPTQPAMNHVLQKVNANILTSKEPPKLVAANRTPIKLNCSKSKTLKLTPKVSAQEKENQGIMWEKRVEKNIQKIHLEQQQKIEENKRKRQEKMQKMSENRMQIEKEREERLRLHQKMSTNPDNKQKRVKHAPQKPVIDLTLKPADPRKPEGPMPPKIPENTHPQALNQNTLHKCPELNTTYQASSVNPLNMTHTLSSGASKPHQASHRTENSKTLQPDSPTCYDISEFPSDSEDEDDAPSEKHVPGWAKSMRLKNNLLQEYAEPFDAEAFFGNTFPNPRLEIIMGTSQRLYSARTSSAIWDSPSAFR